MRKFLSTSVTLLATLSACQSSQRSDDKVEDTDSTRQADSVDESVRSALRGPPDRRWSHVDDDIVAPIWSGNDDRGALYVPLWRGVASALEDYVPAPANGDCTKMKGTLRIDWNKSANTVHYLIKYRGLIPHPNIHRTEGVNWTPNPFHVTRKDFSNAGYRLWTLFGRVNSGTIPFYYDPSTLKLLGSQYDFPNGPPLGGHVIVQPFPIFPIIPSALFHAREDGSVEHEYTTPYDHVTAEGGAVSYSANSFLPLDLCQAAPLQPTISQLRPYISPWQPASAGPSWAEILHAGPIFDTTIDSFDDDGPGGVFPYPYVYSDVSILSNIPAFQGGIPNNFTLHIPSVIQNVAPGFRPIPDGNGRSCKPFYQDPHINTPRFCELPH